MRLLLLSHLRRFASYLFPLPKSKFLTQASHGLDSSLHIIPALGKLKLKTLTPANVRGLHREKLDTGLSPATVRKIHSTLHKALAQAVADGLLPRNAADVKAPRPVLDEMRPLSEDEVRRFLEAARGNAFETLYVLAITTGLRRGELLGLRWDDADLEKGTLRVGRSPSPERKAVISWAIRRRRRDAAG